MVKTNELAVLPKTLAGFLCLWTEKNSMVTIGGVWIAIHQTLTTGNTGLQKNTPILTDGGVSLAEQEGFEPSVPFWGTHDFQSCPL